MIFAGIMNLPLGHDRDSIRLRIAWFVLVLVPVFLFLGTDYAARRQAGEERRHRSAVELQGTARSILEQTDPMETIRRVRSGDVSAAAEATLLASYAEGGPGSWPAVLVPLSEFLFRGTPFTRPTFFPLSDLLGWSFKPIKVRESPKIPISVRFGQDEAWLVWERPTPVASGSIAVYRLADIAPRMVAGISRLKPDAVSDWILLDQSLGKIGGTLSASQAERIGLFSSSFAGDSDNPRVVSLSIWVSPRVRLGLLRRLPAAGIDPGTILVILLSIFGCMAAWASPDLSQWSMRWKFGFFILYLTGVPLFISFLQNRTFLPGLEAGDQLNLRQQAVSTLLDFDREFKSYEHLTAFRLAEIRNHSSCREGYPQALQDRMQRLIDTDQLMLFFAFDGLGRWSIELVRSTIGPLLRDAMSPFYRDFMAKKLGLPPPELSLLDRILTDHTYSTPWGVYLTIKGRLLQLSNNEEQTYFFSDVLEHHRLLATAPYVLGFSIEKSQLVRAYLKNRLPGRHLFRIVALERKSQKWFPEGFQPSPALKTLAIGVGSEKTSGYHLAQDDSGRDVLLVGMPGQELTGMDLFAVVGHARLGEGSSRKRRLTLKNTGICLSFSLFAWFVLAGSLLEPLKQLLEGIGRFRRRELQFRFPPMGEDELGKLAQGFNRVIEVSEEVNLAKTVQKRIFPDAQPAIPGYRFSAEEFRSLRLDGGFREWFADREGGWNILIGTVSGEGISAALVAGMVKALSMYHQDCHNGLGDFFPGLHKSLQTLFHGGQTMCLLILRLDPAGHRFDGLLAGIPGLLCRDGEDPAWKVLPGSASPLGAAGELAISRVSGVFRPGTRFMFAAFPQSFSGTFREWEEWVRERPDEPAEALLAEWRVFLEKRFPAKDLDGGGLFLIGRENASDIGGGNS